MHGKIIGSHLLVQQPVRAGAYIGCASVPGEQIWGSDSLIREAFAHLNAQDQACEFRGLSCGCTASFFDN
jgi:hypothetical protein